MLIHAAKTALSAAFCWWLALRFGLHDGYWGAISAIIVLQSNFDQRLPLRGQDNRDGDWRVVGSAFRCLGRCRELAFWPCLPQSWLRVTGNANELATSGSNSVPPILMLVQKPGSHWTLALDRVGEVFLGIVVALLVSTLVFPDRARLRLRDGLAQEFLLLGAFFEAVLQGFRGRPAESLAEARERVLTALRENNQLLEAFRHEPAGGPGWREGLGMLAQFGRSIFDALVALEIAVRDSHEDAYARQLEPSSSVIWQRISKLDFTMWPRAFTGGASIFRQRG